jgi:hypothetical protein
MPQQIITVPFSGQLIGQGFNSETAENVGTALEVDSVFEDSSTDAQTSSSQFELVASQDSLLETLGVSASADGRIGMFSGGAKMSFSEEHAVNTFSSYVAGRSFIQNAIRHGKGFRLTDAAKALLAAGRMDEFKKAFGDRFVRSLFTGGEFIVIARTTSISEEHQRKLSVALHGEYNGVLDSGSFRAAFDTAMRETSGHTEVSVKMLQTGGQSEQLAFTGPDATAIMERLKQLPAFVHAHAGGLQTELASDDTIPLPIPTPEEREDRDIVLRDCAHQKSSFLKTISDLQVAMEPNGPLIFAELPSAEALTVMQGQYRDALSALIAHAIKVSTGRMDPPKLFKADPAPPPVLFKKQPFVSLSAEVFQGRWESHDNNRFERLTIFAEANNTATANLEFNPAGGSGAAQQLSSEGHIDQQEKELVLTIHMQLFFGFFIVFRLKMRDPETMTGTELQGGGPGPDATSVSVFHRVA